MADSIPDLWGDGIDLDDLSPGIILNTQAANIEKRTKGLIVAEVIQRKSNSVTELMFDIKSQAARHRSRLLVCRHLEDNVYPVWVTARVLFVADAMDQTLNLFGLDEEEWSCTAMIYEQEDFFTVVAKILRSVEVKAKISSMIAKSNESKQRLDHLIVEEVVSELQSR